MLKLIDLTFHTNTEFADPYKLIEAQQASLGYVIHISSTVTVEVIKHLNNEARLVTDNVTFNFFKANNSFINFPFKTYRYLKKIKPDIILVQGFIFPMQILFLKLFITKQTVIIAQHHGERPFLSFLKRMAQQFADKYIKAYLFTSKSNAEEWLERKVIKGRDKIIELQAGSTAFKKQLPSALNKRNNSVFLWVGRLNNNKDPLNILKAFSKYLQNFPFAKLYMIYHTRELLPEVEELINNTPALKASVMLIGQVKQRELETWYNSANYYISGSHEESCGFALLEAMACGCIPIVTNIPTFRKITKQGELGLLFEPGDEDSLIAQLSKLPLLEEEQLSDKITAYFEKELSFREIAADLYLVCKRLCIN